jgi:hypothetical protein
MRRFTTCALLAAVAITPRFVAAQEQTRVVQSGGVKVAGWTGKADGTGSIETASFVSEGKNFHITTGPAITYWNPANTASGDYTVSATFTEPKYMNLNDHDHPYGIVIGGNDLGTDNQSLLYCAVYGEGKFIVRGFSPAGQRGVFRLNGGGEANASIHKAAGKDQPVTQDIAVSVKGDKVTCSVNGTVVGTYDKSAVVGTGKLKSTDGVYGIRTAHNTEVVVSNFKLTKP